MSNTIRVFLCDDHTLFRQGLRKLLELAADIKIVGEADDGQEMLEALKKTGPDIILMDTDVSKTDWPGVLCQAKKTLPHTEIIILTIYEDESRIFRAIKAGAKGYMLKNASIDELIEAVRRVHKGEALLAPVVVTKVLKEFVLLDKRKMQGGDKFYCDLTEREKEILRLIALGGTNKDIARKLTIAEKTVKNHLSHIFSTLNVNNRTQAAIYALEKKL